MLPFAFVTVYNRVGHVTWLPFRPVAFLIDTMSLAQGRRINTSRAHTSIHTRVHLHVRTHALPVTNLCRHASARRQYCLLSGYKLEPSYKQLVGDLIAVEVESMSTLVEHVEVREWFHVGGRGVNIRRGGDFYSNCGNHVHIYASMI